MWNLDSHFEESTKHTLRVCETRVLRKIFGRKGKEVIGDWRKQPNEELHDLLCLPNGIWKFQTKNAGTSEGT
jgi:hypothetical protein